MGHATNDLIHILRVYWSLLLGNVVEWYEFAIYGYLEPALEEKFFRGSAIAAWLGFGVTFFARPLGGAVFGVVGDRLGRSVAVNITIIGMLIGTCGQGCLPTFDNGETAGIIGVVCLIFLRLLQGMSAAGEISTISTYIAEVGRRESLGMSMSMISMTCNVGFLLAKAVVFAMEAIFGKPAVHDWGWRVPFILALVPGLISVWGRRFMPESEAYLEEQTIAREKSAARIEGGVDAADVQAAAAREKSVRNVVTNHSSNILIGVGGVASFAVLQYGGFVWTSSFLAKRGMPPSGSMLASLTARVLMILLALPVGWLTDRKGIAWVVFTAAAALAVCGLPFFMVLDAYPTNVPIVVAVVGVGYAILGALGGSTFFFYVVELFPTSVRGAAVGISYNIGFSVFGGLAPMLCEASLNGSALGPGLVLSFGGLLTAVTVLTAQICHSQGLVKLTHVREQPYFSSSALCGAIGDNSKAKRAQQTESSEGDSTADESS